MFSLTTNVINNVSPAVATHGYNEGRPMQNKICPMGITGKSNGKRY